MTNLTSRSNPKIKQVRALQQRKERTATGFFVVEGIRHVGEAFAAHADVQYLCYAPGLLENEYALQLIREQSARDVPCFAVEPDLFISLAEKENPQGLLAVVRQPHLSLESLTPQNFPFGVGLIAPQDPGNLGSILRTIDAVGANGLLLIDDPTQGQYSADPYHPSAVRASMGALFWYPLVMTGFANFARWSGQHGYHIYGTSAHATQDYRRVERYERPLVLLMGSERAGLTPEQTAACELVLSMPMRGRVTSLNLSVATGIMLYSILEKSG